MINNNKYNLIFNNNNNIKLLKRMRKVYFKVHFIKNITVKMSLWLKVKSFINFIKINFY